ncbi:MAG TPA: hypothetical protein VN976_17110 [Verrucomicrobiae bacterium]|nr:hypothetical protein [Verrucomicrobiae bacterium]
MICPNCKCEYIRGVTQCADCGVALVDALDPSASDPQAGLEVVSVWEGNDPSESAAVKDALEKAGIPVIDQEAAGYFIFPSMRPKTEIYVSSKNVEEAKKVLLDLEAWDDPEEMSEGVRESLELPESDIPESDEQTSQLLDSSDNWDQDDPVTEVWNGDKEEFADTLTACLREIGIGSRKLSEAGHWRLVVRPEQEARAREVVREIVEASPPE